MLVSALAEVYHHFEVMGIRVGFIYLNPNEMAVLAKDECFDVETHREVLEHLSWGSGGSYEGCLFGAFVFSSDKVPMSHVGVIPEDFKAELLGGAGCIPLGL